jgi:hypothetical protein
VCVCVRAHVCSAIQIFSCIKNSEFVKFAVFRIRNNLIFSGSEIVDTKYLYYQNKLQSLSSEKLAQVVTLLACFGRCPVRILDETLTTITYNFHDFP